MEAIQRSPSKHRIKFLNLHPIQMENRGLYADMVHHHGPLSMLIVNYIYQHIASRKIRQYMSRRGARTGNGEDEV